ncbi:MAG: hypothetical protein IPF87_14055 [Gemmatimonadetes bacterium]|nr:hypothetical protein [Gemmatimonadota bacterium]
MSDRVHATQQTLTAIDLQQLQLAREAEVELEAMAKDEADLLLLSDYSARALTPEAIAAVEDRLGRDEAFRELAMTLLGARDFVRARVERETEAATAAADAAWRRLQDRETTELWSDGSDTRRQERSEALRARGEPTPRLRMRLLLRLGAASVAVVLLVYAATIGVPFVRRSAMMQERWEVHRERGMLAGYKVKLSDLMSVSGMGPAFVAVRRRGVLDSGLGVDEPQEVYAEAPFISIHASSMEGRELQLETPLITLRTRDGQANITAQAMGARVISVASGRVVVTVAAEPNRTITIGEGFELAVKADGTIDRTPAKGVSGYRRVPVEETSK